MEESHYLNCKSRAQNYNPPVDLRLLDYVSIYDNNLMCAICRCPFVDPVVLSECDHVFCRDCIRQSWNSNTSYTPLGPRGDCPTCRTPAKLGPRSATSKILVNLVDELVVHCPKRDDGCKAEVRRCEVQDHVNIYCGYTVIECTDDDCTLPVRRKDAAQGCLHFGVSCLSCHKELQKWKLEAHWRSECADRRVHCDMCKSSVFYRDLEAHRKEACPAMSVSCPGKALGCTSRSKRGHAELHAKSCTFAKLAPVLLKQQERLDEQEAAQKEMSRKLEVLEGGFQNMQGILYPPGVETSQRSADNSLTPSLQERLFGSGTAESTTPTGTAAGYDWTESAVDEDAVSPAETMHTAFSSATSPRQRAAPLPPGPRPADLPEPFSSDFDIASPTGFPPPATNGGPYASPLHHLLSMHESLRDEMTRVSSALSELDGRHSMQILNENLRTREEISYLAAQTAGLQRQVHWLTSSALQRQQGRSPTPGASSSGAGGAMMDAGAGAGVEAAVGAVSTAATALRGAARMVNVGGNGSGSGTGTGMRRGTSEEGRTKL
ncbi:uncharacterized protein LTR77_008907 [Saxophila tyrrhenica]|uniref:TRAF-type zinc finger protein n=1 Tax=Saxophila tyrrhenica TaxID=1690608 RepID=A0AAV9P117_9PEZI|nr:hypothetical protein LTR77_008907 [Saxophila tyrrhenica]